MIVATTIPTVPAAIPAPVRASTPNSGGAVVPCVTDTRASVPTKATCDGVVVGTVTMGFVEGIMI